MSSDDSDKIRDDRHTDDRRTDTPVREPPEGNWAAIIQSVKACVSAKLNGVDTASRDDVVQNALEKLFVHSGKLIGADLKAWKRYASNIAETACIDYFRAKQRRRSMLVLDVPLELDEDETDDDEQESPSPIRPLIGSLSAEDIAIMREDLLEVLNTFKGAILLRPTEQGASSNRAAGAQERSPAKSQEPSTRRRTNVAHLTPRKANLARRDLAIMQMKFQGSRNDEIAKALGLTAGVVSNALTRFRNIVVQDHPEWDEGRKRQGPKRGTKVVLRVSSRTQRAADSVRSSIVEVGGRTFSISCRPIPDPLHLGQRIQLRVTLTRDDWITSMFDLVNPIPVSDEVPVELYFNIETQGLAILSDHLVRIPLYLLGNSDFSATFELAAVSAGVARYTLTLLSEDVDLLFNVKELISAEVNVLPGRSDNQSVLPMLHVSDDVTSLPDFVLEIEREERIGSGVLSGLHYRLTTLLAGGVIEGEDWGYVKIDKSMVEQLGVYLDATLARADLDTSEQDSRLLIDIGRFLYDRFCSSQLQQLLQETASTPSTWLILDDGNLHIPWELILLSGGDTVTPRFFGDVHQIARWIVGLGSPFYGAIPVADAPQARKASDDGPDPSSLLAASHISWPLDLVDGVHTQYFPLPVASGKDRMIGQEHSGIDRGMETSSWTLRGRSLPGTRVSQFRTALPRMWMQRPLVTLGTLGDRSQNRDQKYAIRSSFVGQQSPVLQYLRAGACAAVACQWPPQERAERVFWRAFYASLRQQTSLGESFRLAQQEVRRTIPGSIDSLAFTLFGHPEAQVYRPSESAGYVTVEFSQVSLPSDTTAHASIFISIRDQPPSSFHGRLSNVSKLPDEMSAFVFLPSAGAATPVPVSVKRVSRNMLQGIAPVRVMQGDTFPVVVQLLHRERHVTTLHGLLSAENGQVGDTDPAENTSSWVDYWPNRNRGSVHRAHRSQTSGMRED